MFDRILVPVDSADPPFSERILNHVKLLLRREDSKVDLFSVVRATEGMDPRGVSLQLEAAERRLEVLSRGLTRQGIEVVTDTSPGDPVALIRQRIESTKPSLVAMSTHGRSGPVRWVRGSVAEAVLRNTDVPLLLCNPARAGVSATRIRRILVPLDGSVTARRILPLAASLAERHGATLLLCRVATQAYVPVNGAAYVPTAIDSGGIERSLEPIAKQLREAGQVVTTHSTVGNPASEILSAVEREGADLVMMMSHGHSGLDRLVFGSVAESVVRRSPTPVIVQRACPTKL